MEISLFLIRLHGVDGLTYTLMDYHLTWYKCCLIETMYSELDRDPYLKGQGHTRH